MIPPRRSPGAGLFAYSVDVAEDRVVGTGREAHPADVEADQVHQAITVRESGPAFRPASAIRHGRLCRIRPAPKVRVRTPVTSLQPALQRV